MWIVLSDGIWMGIEAHPQGRSFTALLFIFLIPIAPVPPAWVTHKFVEPYYVQQKC